LLPLVHKRLVFGRHVIGCNDFVHSTHPTTLNWRLYIRRSMPAQEQTIGYSRNCQRLGERRRRPHCLNQGIANLPTYSTRLRLFPVLLRKAAPIAKSGWLQANRFGGWRVGEQALS